MGRHWLETIVATRPIGVPWSLKTEMPQRPDLVDDHRLSAAIVRRRGRTSGHRAGVRHRSLSLARRPVARSRRSRCGSTTRQRRSRRCRRQPRRPIARRDRGRRSPGGARRARRRSAGTSVASAGRARASAHKRLARERLASGRPAGRVPSSTTDVPIRAIGRGGCAYPAVVKPVALSGSRGVIRANTPAALVAAFERVARCWRGRRSARCTGSEHEILIEDFIPAASTPSRA